MRGWIAVLVLVSVSVGASEKPAPVKAAELVRIQIRGKYGTQATHLVQKAGKWICRTELLPYAEAKGDPLQGVVWGSLEKEIRATPNEQKVCRDRVRIEDRRGKKTKTIAGCLATPEMARVIAQLNERCGRF
jgi:hypothetical protein